MITHLTGFAPPVTLPSADSSQLVPSPESRVPSPQSRAPYPKPQNPRPPNPAVTHYPISAIGGFLHEHEAKIGIEFENDPMRTSVTTDQRRATRARLGTRPH